MSDATKEWLERVREAAGEWHLLRQGDGVYYITQERGMAPGISGDWPEIIGHGDTVPRHGRLVKKAASNLPDADPEIAAAVADVVEEAAGGPNLRRDLQRALDRLDDLLRERGYGDE